MLAGEYIRRRGSRVRSQVRDDASNGYAEIERFIVCEICRPFYQPVHALSYVNFIEPQLAAVQRTWVVILAFSVPSGWHIIIEKMMRK